MSTDTNKPASNVKPFGIKLPGDFSTSAHGHTLSSEQLASMSPDAIAYLLKVGFTGSMTDSGAMPKAAKEGKTPDAIQAELVAKRNKRFAAIVAGEVSHGGTTGARATPIEQFQRQVAKERIKAACAANGKTMPKGEALGAMIDKLLAGKLAEEIKAEANARMATAASGAAAIAEALA